MCAQFLIETTIKDIRDHFGVEVPFEEYNLPSRVLPGTMTPVVYSDDGLKTLSEMRFGLIPSWSKDPKAAFSTHNARIDGIKNDKYTMIYESSIWKTPIKKTRCVVPMTAFRETSYWGKYEGHWVIFRPKDKGLLGAAAIYSEWTDKKTGEVTESFSIITDDPFKAVEEVGHPRSPLILNEKAYDEWMDPGEMDGEDAVKFLRSNRAKVDFETEAAEAMGPKWATRLKAKRAEFDEEAEFRKNRGKYESRS